MKKYIHTALKGTLTALLLMVGISVWAEDGVAKIGDTPYTTLQAAITAAQANETVELIAESEITESVTNTNTNSFTINLNGKTWNGNGETAALTQNATSGTISITGTSGSMGAIICNAGGSLSITGGTVSGNITNSGTITISGGTFSGTISNTGNLSISGGTFINATNDAITNNEGTITITGGTFSTQPEAGWIAQGYVVKTNTGESTTTYTVEPKVKVLVNLTDATQEQTDAANALAGNTSVSETTGLGDNGSLDVSITGVNLDANNNVTSATFEVTPKDANGNTITVFSGTYTFRLPISASVAEGKWVNLKHNETYIPASQVAEEGGNKFVTVTTTSFSPFSYYVLDNAVAKIGEQLYETVTDAIAAVPESTETTIELIADATENIAIPANKNVKLVGGEHSVSGTITSSGTLTIVSGTYTNTTENALKIDGEGTITINAGVFSKQPAASMIADDHEVMVGAESKFVVAAAGTAEAKIVTTVGEVETTTLYQTVALAFAAASTNETTITLLKNVAADEITIPENANITLVIADGVTLSKPITNSGTLTITSGAISGAITNAGTLTISDGTFTGTITNNNETEGSLTITGGTFTKKPTGKYTCGDGKDLVINEAGVYVVTDITSAEAQIDGNKYLTIDKAITAAGETPTTITLLKDLEGEERSITIPATADITLVIANDVTLTKPISVDGKLAITSGTISETTTITITDFDAVLKISAGVTHPAVALSTSLQTDNVLKSKAEGEPVVTTYWAEKKFEAKIDEGITGDAKTAAESLVANTSIKEVTGLADNQSLTITVTSVELTTGKVTKATFEVKLINADGQEVTGTVPEVKFRLPIHSSITGTPWVNLWHNGIALPGMKVISETNGYVTVTTTSFSPFSYEIIENPIAQIGETKFGTVAAAIDKATATETEITLLQSVSENINVTTGKNVKLAIGSLTVSGTITNAGTLTIADGTVSGTDKTITNTGALTISGSAKISNPVSASAGTLAISGGTINEAVTTSGTAGLNITDGTITGALTVGGSGTNTISGGTFAENVTTSQNTTISGGTFSKTGDGAINVTAGTLTIEGVKGGTFTGGITKEESATVAISGGTHTVLPVPGFCATGYMPIRTAADVPYTMTNHWTIVDDTNLSINNHLNVGTYSVKTATYHRNTGMVSAGNAETKYGTICLPFEIKAALTEPSIKLYTATSIVANTLTITEVDYPVTAGTPLIFELRAEASNMTVTSTNDGGIAVNTTTPGATPVPDNLLVGTFAGTVLNSSSSPVLSDKIYYLNGDAFHQAVTSLTVPAFRAYLDTTEPVGGGGAKPMVLSIMKDGNENQTTGISAVEAFEGVTEVYDLNGLKQSGLQRGINIMRRADGSTLKVIVK